MSLINRVLHDLEDRHAFFNMPAASVINDLRSAQDYAFEARSPRKRLLWIMALIVTIGTAAVLAGRGLTVPADASLHAASASAAAAPALSEPPAAPAPVPPPAAISAPPPAAGPGVALKLDMAPGRSLALAAAGSAAGTAHPAPSMPSVADVAAAASAGTTRVRVAFDGGIPDYTLSVLKDPDRLQIEMDGAALPGAVLGRFREAGVVTGMRRAVAESRSRLVFDLATPVTIESTHVEVGPDGRHVLTVAMEQREALVLDLGTSLTPPDEMQVQRHAGGDAAPESAEPTEVVHPNTMQRIERSTRARSEAETAFDAGVTALREGRVAVAIERLNRTLSLEPAHLRAAQFLAAVLLENGDQRAAERVLSAGLDHHPQDPALLQSYARLQFGRGLLEEALNTLGRSRPEITEHPEYYALGAAILQQQDRHAEAAGVYRQLLGTDARNGVWWVGLGISLEDLGRSVEALKAFRNAQQLQNVPPEMALYVAERIEALGRGGG